MEGLCLRLRRESRHQTTCLRLRRESRHQTTCEERTEDKQNLACLRTQVTVM